MQDDLCDVLDLDVIETAKLIKKQVDASMANGIATELRTRGFEPKEFTVLAYGGNGPLHACGIASALGVASAGTAVFVDVLRVRCGDGEPDAYPRNEHVDGAVQPEHEIVLPGFRHVQPRRRGAERRGREDLERQGMAPSQIRYRLELDMRYGNQRVQTAVVTPISRLKTQRDVLTLMELFHESYGSRFGDGSQSPETGVRINTLRVCTYVEQPSVKFAKLAVSDNPLPPPQPVGYRECHFVGHDGPQRTAIYDDRARAERTQIEGPAVITTRATTFLVEPGWIYQATGRRVVPAQVSKEIDMQNDINAEDRALLDKFIADNTLFLGPDPEIMRNHSILPRSKLENEVLERGVDPHQVHHVRGLINSALSEAFTMVNQMGAAPGAKWGDLVTAIYTAQGDLSMIAPHGIIAFAACCFYPIRFIIKNWVNDPTVGVRDGDGFIHNDARYGGIHNTDQSMMMPLFKGELVCWLSSTIHEGENGSTEPAVCRPRPRASTTKASRCRRSRSSRTSS